MTVNKILAFMLVCMFIVSVWNHVAARRRDIDMAKVIRRIDEMLQTWAEHWGEPTEEVKPLLLAIIEKWKTERRIAERRTKP